MVAIPFPLKRAKYIRRADEAGRPTQKEPDRRSGVAVSLTTLLPRVYFFGETRISVATRSFPYITVTCDPSIVASPAAPWAPEIFV